MTPAAIVGGSKSGSVFEIRFQTFDIELTVRSSAPSMCEIVQICDGSNTSPRLASLKAGGS